LRQTAGGAVARVGLDSLVAAIARHFHIFKSV
jgi:hypothetical protein